MNDFPIDSMLRKVDSCNFDGDHLTGGLPNYGAISFPRLKERGQSMP